MSNRKGEAVVPECRNIDASMTSTLRCVDLIPHDYIQSRGAGALNGRCEATKEAICSTRFPLLSYESLPHLLEKAWHPLVG